MTATTLAQRPAWQESAVLDFVGETAADRFTQIITSVPHRTEFTVNDLRDRLDAADVPNSQRGGLMAGAVASGLIRVAQITQWGVTADLRVRSTGASAHGAHVRVYRRCTYIEASERGGAA